MKHIDFIDQDVKDGFGVCRDGKSVDIADKIRACDHHLVLSDGLPRTMLGCPKCGWWQFASNVPKHVMEMYEIEDQRKMLP